MSHETQASHPAPVASAPTDESRADPVLAVYRKSIDNIDAAIIHMLAERFRITQAVGEYKAKVTLPRPTLIGRSGRSRGCAHSQKQQILILNSARSF